jgi:SAM-dependent methyltransferase
MAVTCLTAEAEHRAPPGSCADFDRLAGVYRWLEWLTFGPWLYRARCAWLAEAERARRALIFGDGDGRFTARLLRTNPNVTVQAIDASPAMLRALRRRAGGNANRLDCRVMDARRWEPVPESATDRAFDLVITHFFLDCLTTAEVAALAARVRAAAAPGALWIVSEFAIPPNGFGRWFARPLVGALYLAFGRLTGLRMRRLPDHTAALASARFRLARRRTRLGGLLVSEIWQANSDDSM